MKSLIIFLGMSAVLLAAGIWGCGKEQPATKENSAPSPEAARETHPEAANKAPLSPQAARGKDVFDKQCFICHYAESDVKKIGPGLKGLTARGTFTVGTKGKVTDQNLKAWIEKGDNLMPPFKNILTQEQIKDVVAYVMSL